MVQAASEVRNLSLNTFNTLSSSGNPISLNPPWDQEEPAGAVLMDRDTVFIEREPGFLPGLLKTCGLQGLGGWDVSSIMSHPILLAPVFFIRFRAVF